MKSLIFAVLGVFVFIGCQQKATKVTTQEPVMSENNIAENLIKGQPVILDARPAFEFNLAHVPGAINVRWEDFSQTDPRARGLLQKDLFSVARRLSLIGIEPHSRVLVLGKGSQGMGEEGRIAWTLKVLGVNDVYTLLHSSYREMNTNKEVPMTQNKPYWKPHIDDTLMISYKEFKELASVEDPQVVILDVRLKEEFSLRNLSYVKGVKAIVTHLDWKEFFGEKGLPARDMEGALSQRGISKDTRILVISNHGVRSGAATYVLRNLGYSRATNFAGGYEQWK